MVLPWGPVFETTGGPGLRGPTDPEWTRLGPGGVCYAAIARARPRARVRNGCCGPREGAKTRKVTDMRATISVVRPGVSRFFRRPDGPLWWISRDG